MRGKVAGIGCCLAAALGFKTAAQITDDWTRNFRIGVQLTFNIKANFELNGPIEVRRPSTGPTGVPGTDHFYDDGYVRVDNTGNAGGVTGYWGYEDATQVNPATQQLVMHSVRSYDVSYQSSIDAIRQVGMDVAYGGQIHDWGRVRIGWELGYGFTPMNLEETTPIPALFARDVQSFSTSGITLPPAPYSGGPSGLGPTIPDVATALPDDVLGGTITGSRGLDVTLHAIRLGPTVFWRFQPHWALSGSLGPAMGVVAGSYKYDQTLHLNDGSVAADSGKIASTDVVFGGFASATLHWRVVADADLYANVQFLSLQDAGFGNAQRQGELGLGAAIVAAIGVNWPF